MSGLSIVARAKVNLHLRVVGKRPDGYHDLVTLFDRITLADRLVIAPRPSGISLRCATPGVPLTADNLAWRGAAAALAAAGSDRGVSIDLEKGVPAGAGLGGGSADAAAALVGTDSLYDLHLDDATLLAAGRAIGADVPFFVQGHIRDRTEARRWMAVGRGVGEKLVEIPRPPPLVYVLMNPGFEVSTARVFQLGRFGSAPSGATDEFVSRGIEGVVPGSVEQVLGLLKNDLEEITASLHPEIGEGLRELRSAGALGARMSGSGPTVFGLFATVAAASAARDQLERRFAGTKTKVFVAEGA
jgi:4-diphosphocytidyl-2-C-methyl-D-erythritol kinase